MLRFKSVTDKMELTCCSDIKLFVCFLTVLFGMGSWIAINGVFVELPILVTQLPEGWSLPTYMAVVIQAANIAPLAYMVWSLLSPDRTYEIPIVFLIVFIGSAASLILAFFWREISNIGDKQHSVALLISMFFLSLVDCSSSVVFLPFMNRFKPKYITTYYIGEGFSALVPSLTALAQGVGQTECRNISSANASSNITIHSMEVVYKPPTFEVRDFFLFICAMMILCGFAFGCLNYLPYCKTEHSRSSNDRKIIHELEMHSRSFREETVHLNKPNRTGRNEKDHMEMTRPYFVYYLFLIAWVNALTNGVYLAIQSYACLPYGTKTYHLAATLCSISNPAACFVALFLPVGSSIAIGIITAVGTFFSIYILVVAIGSPTPFLAGTVTGAALVITVYVVVYLMLTFTKVSIARLFRCEGRKALLWCGALTQFGSAIGSIAIFIIVNIYQLFKQKAPCA